MWNKCSLLWYCNIRWRTAVSSMQHWCHLSFLKCFWGKETLHLSHSSCLWEGKKVFVCSPSDWIQMTILSAAFCQSLSVTGATAERCRSHTVLISPDQWETKWLVRLDMIQKEKVILENMSLWPYIDRIQFRSVELTFIHSTKWYLYNL